MAVATEVFGLSRPELGFQPYEVIVCAPTKTVRLRDGVFSARVEGTLDDALTADTIVVPNRPDPFVRQPKAVLEMVRQAHAKRRRLVAFCTGAFTLADAGVLTGRTVATHWRWADEFRQRYPHIRCESAKLFVDDGTILTAAGSASALDLCLHIVRNDFGADIASSVSSRLVFSIFRDGGQQQFWESSPIGVPQTDPIGRLQAALLGSLDHPQDVASMAASVAMAPSTFHRAFRARVGQAPVQWLTARRIDASRRLLETTSLSIESIARQVGLGTASNLRLQFARHVAISPTAYRERMTGSP